MLLQTLNNSTPGFF